MDRVNLRLVDEVKRLGAFDLQACYNCGHCSALCPLCEGDVSFPRKMIRYAVLGLENKILSSAEPWLCYYCGECSETCPRDADPGGLMMALRRYSIRKYSLGRIADMFCSAFSSGLAWVLLSAAAIVAIILFHNPDMNLEEVEWLSFITLERIHNAGLAITGFIALAFLVNVASLTKALRGGISEESFTFGRLARSFGAALRESILQRRFNTCQTGGKRYAAHLAVSWGFAGMFLATLIVMGIDYDYLHISRAVPFLLGSVFGFITLLGSAYFIYQRITRRIESSRFSHHSDWVFLVLIFLSVLSGFVMVVFKYLSLSRAAYVSFAVHLVLVFDLLVSLPFTKFAHMVYRPIALWLSGVK